MGKDRKYEPSPSLLGSCVRKLVYHAMDTEKRLEPYSVLRAERGTKLHDMLPTVLEYVLKNNKEFSSVVAHRIIGTETRVYFSWGQGTYDALVELTWQSGDKELVVVDLKNYARVPEQPYESNILQVQAYVEGAIQNGINAKRGLLVYFPDAGSPECFWVNRNPDIDEVAKNIFTFVGACLANNRMPERLIYTDKRCSTCAYRWTCWDDQLLALSEDLREEPTNGELLPVEVQDVLSKFIQDRDLKSSAQKAYQNSYGLMMKAMIDNKLNTIQYGDERITLVKCVRANGELYYQIR